jgi:hypothetical protein
LGGRSPAQPHHLGSNASDSKFQLERVQEAPVSNEEILTGIRHAATLAGTNAISQRLYSEFGKFDPATASRRFGTGNKAVIAAGLDVANEINISDARLFENLMLLWEHYGRQPRRSELARPPPSRRERMGAGSILGWTR